MTSQVSSRGLTRELPPSYNSCGSNLHPGSAWKAGARGRIQHALDNCRDSCGHVAIGLWPSRRRRPHPLITRVCSDCGGMEPACRPQVLFLRRPDHAQSARPARFNPALSITQGVSAAAIVLVRVMRGRRPGKRWRGIRLCRKTCGSKSVERNEALFAW